MDEAPQQNQRISTNPDPNQNQNLRRPANAGVPRRLPTQPATAAPSKNKRKLWEYVLPGLTAGGSFGYGIINIFS